MAAASAAGELKQQGSAPPLARRLSRNPAERAEFRHFDPIVSSGPVSRRTEACSVSARCRDRGADAGHPPAGASHDAVLDYACWGHARTRALCAPGREPRRRGREQGQLRKRRRRLRRLGARCAGRCAIRATNTFAWPARARVEQRHCGLLDGHVARLADADFSIGRSPGRPSPRAADRGFAAHWADCVAACDVPSCWGAGS